MRLTVFGLGEAGSAIAADLAAAGAEVHGFDPAAVPTPEGVHRHTDAASAVADSEAVIAVTAAADAWTALRQALRTIPAGAVYADLATAAAGIKHGLAAEAESVGLRFVDVALMAPVPGKGLHTPALASGSGARAFIETMSPLGMPVEFAGDRAGDAATRKLLRSVVMKGLAALIAESMEAAHSAGLAEETWANLVEQFTAADDALLRRLVEGTGPHSLRRLHEMKATADLLEELGVDPVMTRSTVESLRRVHAGAHVPTLPAPVSRSATRPPDAQTGTPSSSQ
jgi:3-hydroxyisobutyrate dehydrogenase-like beta-hydroxyacid dehydrogenase